MLTFFNIGKYFVSLMLLFVRLSTYSFLSRSLPAENQTRGGGDWSSLMSLIFHLVVLEFSQQVWKLLANINLCHYFNSMAVSGKTQEHRLWEFLALEPDCHILSSPAKPPYWKKTFFQLVQFPCFVQYELCFWLAPFLMLISTLLETNFHLLLNFSLRCQVWNTWVYY